jgi:hypothetical protein
MTHDVRIERYRHAAGRLRMRAKDTPWADIREDYFRLAKRFEQLADRLEHAENPLGDDPAKVKPSSARSGSTRGQGAEKVIHLLFWPRKTRPCQE